MCVSLKHLDLVIPSTQNHVDTVLNLSFSSQNKARAPQKMCLQRQWKCVVFVFYHYPSLRQYSLLNAHVVT